MDSYQKINPVVNKDLTFFLKKLKLSKYVRFGTSFFLTKNVGLDYQNGYLVVSHAKSHPIFRYNNVKEALLYLSKRIVGLLKLLTFWVVQKNWGSNPGKVIKLRKRLLLKTVRPFVVKKFMKRRFFKNNFFTIFWKNKKLGFKLPHFFKKCPFMYFWILARDMKEDLNKSKFSKKFMKYLFYYRYFKWTTPDFSLNKNFKMFNSQNLFSKFYWKVISSQFAPNIIKDDRSLFNIPTNRLKHTLGTQVKPSSIKLVKLFKKFDASNYMLNSFKFKNYSNLTLGVYFNTDKIFKLYSYFISLNVVIYKNLLQNLKLLPNINLFLSKNLNILSFMLCYFDYFKLSAIKINKIKSLYDLILLKKLKTFNVKNYNITISIRKLYLKLNSYKQIMITNEHFIDFYKWLCSNFSFWFPNLTIKYSFWKILKILFLRLRDSKYRFNKLKFIKKLIKCNKKRLWYLKYSNLKKYKLYIYSLINHVNEFWKYRDRGWQNEWFKMNFPEKYEIRLEQKLSRLKNQKRTGFKDKWFLSRNKNWIFKWGNYRLVKYLIKLYLTRGNKSKKKLILLCRALYLKKIVNLSKKRLKNFSKKIYFKSNWNIKIKSLIVYIFKFLGFKDFGLNLNKQSFTALLFKLISSIFRSTRLNKTGSFKNSLQLTQNANWVLNYKNSINVTVSSKTLMYPLINFYFENKNCYILWSYCQDYNWLVADNLFTYYSKSCEKICYINKKKNLNLLWQI